MKIKITILYCLLFAARIWPQDLQIECPYVPQAFPPNNKLTHQFEDLIYGYLIQTRYENDFELIAGNICLGYDLEYNSAGLIDSVIFNLKDRLIWPQLDRSFNTQDVRFTLEFMRTMPGWQYNWVRKKLGKVYTKQNQVTITLKNPLVSLLHFVFPLYPDKWGGRASSMDFFINPLSLGAYSVQSIKRGDTPGSRQLFAKNSDPPFKTLRLSRRDATDSSSNWQIAIELNPTRPGLLHPSLNKLYYGQNTSLFIAFNCAKFPKEIRLALSNAVNRFDLSESFFHSEKGLPLIPTIVPLSNIYYDDSLAVDPQPKNIDNRLRNSIPKRINFIYPKDLDVGPLVKAICEHLKNSLPEIVIEETAMPRGLMDSTSYDSALFKQKYDLALVEWSFGYKADLDLNSLLHSEENSKKHNPESGIYKYNFFGYSNSQIDNILNEIETFDASGKIDSIVTLANYGLSRGDPQIISDINDMINELAPAIDRTYLSMIRNAVNKRDPLALTNAMRKANITRNINLIYNKWYHKIQVIMVNDPPAIPLVEWYQMAATNPKLIGVEPQLGKVFYDIDKWHWGK